MEAASYQFLSGHIAQAAVYQDVPDNASALDGLVIIGDVASRRIPEKPRSRDRIVTLTIVTLYEAEERAPLLAVMDEIDALDDQTLTFEGWTLAFAFEDDDATLQEDGVTYAGITTFTILALAPD